MTGVDPDFATCRSDLAGPGHSGRVLQQEIGDAAEVNELEKQLFPTETGVGARDLQDDSCYEVAAEDFMPVGSSGGKTQHAMFLGVTWGDCAVRQ